MLHIDANLFNLITGQFLVFFSDNWAKILAIGVLFLVLDLFIDVLHDKIFGKKDPEAHIKGPHGSGPITY